MYQADLTHNNEETEVQANNYNQEDKVGEMPENVTQEIQNEEQIEDAHKNDEGDLRTHNHNEEDMGVELPENVTEAPQNEEHADLRNLPKYLQWLHEYLETSDDNGSLINAEQEISQIRQMLADSQNMNEDAETKKSVIEQIKELINRFVPKLNSKETAIQGTLTKYRIYQGRLLNTQKQLFEDVNGKGYWMGWFALNYDKKLMRSANFYMRLGSVPNIIRYSVFGQVRLDAIIKVLDKSNLNEDDPVGRFLQDYEVTFDPFSDDCSEDIKKQIDIAVYKKKLSDKGIEGIRDETLERLIDYKLTLPKKLIEHLQSCQNSSGDVDAFLNNVINQNGEYLDETQKINKQLKEKIKKINIQINTALSNWDSEYLREIKIEELMACKQNIEELINKAAGNNQ